MKFQDIDHSLYIDFKELVEAAQHVNVRRFNSALELVQVFCLQNPTNPMGFAFAIRIGEMVNRYDIVLTACKNAFDLGDTSAALCERAIIAALHMEDEATASKFLASLTPRTLAGEEGTDIQRLWALFQYAAQAFSVSISPPSLPILPSNSLVSIVMPTTGRPLIKDAIASLINQQYLNWELVIVHARPGELPFTSSDKRVRIINSHQYLNASQARNIGLDEIRGDLFGFLDDDDIYKPNHLATLIPDLRKGGFAAVFADSELVFERVEKGMRNAYKRDPGTPGRNYFPLLMEMRNYITSTEPLFRFDVFGSLRFDEQLPLWEDWDFLLSAFEIAPFRKVNSTTSEVRQRPDEGSSHLSYREVDAFVYDRIFSRHPASRPWVVQARQVYRRIHGEI